MNALRERCKEEAAGARYELFKTTKKYDGDEGRKMHDYPSAEESLA